MSHDGLGDRAGDDPGHGGLDYPLWCPFDGVKQLPRLGPIGTLWGLLHCRLQSGDESGDVIVTVRPEPCLPPTTFCKCVGHGVCSAVERSHHLAPKCEGMRATIARVTSSVSSLVASVRSPG